MYSPLLAALPIRRSNVHLLVLGFLTLTLSACGWFGLGGSSKGHQLTLPTSDGRSVTVGGGNTVVVAYSSVNSLRAPSVPTRLLNSRALADRQIHLVHIVDFNDRIPRPLHDRTTSTLNRRLIQERERIANQHQREGLSRGALQSVHLVTDFDGSLARQVGFQGSTRIMVFDPSGRLARTYAATPSPQELSSLALDLRQGRATGSAVAARPSPTPAPSVRPQPTPATVAAATPSPDVIQAPKRRSWLSRLNPFSSGDRPAPVTSQPSAASSEISTPRSEAEKVAQYLGVALPQVNPPEIRRDGFAEWTKTKKQMRGAGRPSPASDQEILAALQQQFMSDRNLRSRRTQVSVDDGVVTIGPGLRDLREVALAAGLALDQMRVRQVLIALPYPGLR